MNVDIENEVSEHAGDCPVIVQVAQLSQRDRAVGLVGYGQK